MSVQAGFWYQNNYDKLVVFQSLLDFGIVGKDFGLVPIHFLKFSQGLKKEEKEKQVS